MKKVYTVPDDVCSNHFMVIRGAEKALEDGHIVHFLGIEFYEIEKLVDQIQKHCSITDPRVLRNIDRMIVLFKYRQK